MDPLSVTSSALAIIDATAKTVRYVLEVKNADEDIKEVQRQSDALFALFDRLRSLLDNPQTSAKLSSPAEIGALQECSKLLESLGVILQEKFPRGSEEKRKGWRSRLSHRAKLAKWPFTREEFDGIFGKIERYYKLIERALRIEQIQAVLDIDQDKNLNKLPVAEGATFGSFEDQHEPECHPDTRTDLKEDVANWVADPKGSRIFCLFGLAGTGKSTISRTVARTLRDQKQLAASFFFKRGNANRDASRFFSTIALDLARHIPHLRPLLSKTVADDNTIFRKGLGEQFEKLIFGPLSQIDPGVIPKSTSVIVIDALDECEGENNANLIFEFLGQLQKLKAIDLRLFITGRPEIQVGLKEATRSICELRVLHEIQENTIRHDIALFLRTEFEAIRKKRKLDVDWPGEAAILEITEQATPLFIYASVLCRFVAEPRFPVQNRLDTILQSKPTISTFKSKIGRIYTPVLDQLLLNLDPSEEEYLLADFKDIVGTIVLLESALSPRSLSKLLDIPEDQIYCMLDPLRAVLNVLDDPNLPVQIFHKSFPDFLLDERRKQERFWINAKQIHRKIAQRCLSLLSNFLQQDICDVKMPGTFVSDISADVIDQKIPPLVRYACQYWVYHLKQSVGDGKMDESDRDQKFVSEAPLQLYSSALAFVPQNSVVGGISSHTIPSWVRNVPKAPEYWSANVETLEGHKRSVNSVAFSPDGSVLASASNDSKIILWSTASMTMLRVIRTKQATADCIAFSPADGKILASVSLEYKISIWEAKLGTLLRVLEGHKAHVEFIRFSSDGKRLASGGWDHTVKLWDAESGSLLEEVELDNGNKFGCVFDQWEVSSISIE
ncbi:hypothetical protein ABW20_dc0102832 [Dactylellina cionopaga]|nr:hypothetical protein ABW20_dc0102832 [Dactylellina cionopaga]